MIRIRQEQSDAMRAERLTSFEERMRKQLEEVWPQQCQERGEEGVRESIRTGIERAEGYGMDTEHDIARYIHLMYAVTDDFDTNPAMPRWVGQVLHSPILHPSDKMDILWRRAQRELKLLAKVQASRRPN